MPVIHKNKEHIMTIHISLTKWCMALLPLVYAATGTLSISVKACDWSSEEAIKKVPIITQITNESPYLATIHIDQGRITLKNGSRPNLTNTRVNIDHIAELQGSIEASSGMFNQKMIIVEVFDIPKETFKNAPSFDASTALPLRFIGVITQSSNCPAPFEKCFQMRMHTCNCTGTALQARMECSACPATITSYKWGGFKFGDSNSMTKAQGGVSIGNFSITIRKDGTIHFDAHDVKDWADIARRCLDSYGY
jgi:hypothetical protein